MLATQKKPTKPLVNPDATVRTGAAPVAGDERIESLDVLRGVAVLGILVMNITAFAMPFMAYTNPLVLDGNEQHNLGTWFVTHIVFDQKFLSIFSILFGAGVVLMASRAQENSGEGALSFRQIWFRRQGWLLVIGLLHAYLVWFGDILYSYALVGLVIYFCRHWTPRTLILVACFMLPVAPLLLHVGGTYQADLMQRAERYVAKAAAGEELTNDEQAAVDEWAEMQPFVMPGEAELKVDLDAYRGGYGDAILQRAPRVASFQTEGLASFGFWRVGGLMLLGMALMKLRVLSGERPVTWYRRLAILSYSVGIPICVYSAVDLSAHDFDPIYFMRVGNVANYFGSILVALGHIAAVMLIVRSGALRRLVERFGGVGRMALTNYLMHSVVLTTIFYGYGFGLYAEVPRLAQMLLVVVFIAAQLQLSRWWLTRFRFGPVEWLWRSLTYARAQPFRRREA